MNMQKVHLFCFFIVLIDFLLFNIGFAVTRQQFKNSGKLLKKSCMPKNDVTEEQVGEIEQGKFIEDRNVMCYIACIYTMSQIVKNNKINYEAVMKQVDMLFPPELKEPAKAAAANCKDVSKKHKDLCEAAYWTAKCMYDFDPKSFIFP
uniref:Odorant-binding protein 13 n=1 Tax=Streltzoviella insularis TaxID=1206366 RepID=A0A7D5UMJ3_9NEOP|nr:odorant-binding protein 13 [Streltzoviella insularis]